MSRPRRTTLRSSARKPTRQSPEANRWVERTLAQMSLEEKLGQLIMLPFYGEFTSVEGAEYRVLRQAVERDHVGGFMLAARTGPFGIERGEPYATAATIDALQKVARAPLLFAADFERGTAMRLAHGTSFPHAMAVAATGRPEDAYTVGRITAQEARAVGISWIFAPVADVNSNPDNPIINMRSFGEDPERVAEFVQAYIRGVEENGAIATAKHFPGHGDTVVDSHLDLPAVNSDRAHLDEVELVPFRAAFAAKVSSVMSGHLAVPALDSGCARPATLSANILAELLRRHLRFDGLVVTDALDMGGVARRYTPGEAAVQAILAGADVLLLTPAPEAAIKALRNAVKSGRLPLSRVDEAVTRILRAKAHLGLHRNRFVDLDSLSHSLARAEFERAAADIANRGITLLRDPQAILPLDARRPLNLSLLSIAGDPDPFPGRAFEAEIRRHTDLVEALHFDTKYAPIVRFDDASLRSSDAVILAIFVRVADRKGSVALPPEQVAAVRRVLALQKPVIVASFGSPYLIREFPEAKTWLGIFSNADVAQTAAARAIFGQVPVAGRIPVSVPGVVKRGEGLSIAAMPMKLVPLKTEMAARLAPAFQALEQGVADGAYPGAVLAVGHRGALSVRACGKSNRSARAASVQPDTIYDTASLTKPVVTTTLAAMLCEAGQLELAAPVSRYLSSWACGPDAEQRARVTIAHLLTHTSGLPAHEDYFRMAKGHAEIVARAVAQRLVYEPGSRTLYSDIGFILLGEIIENLTGHGLEELSKQRIFEPLGMNHTTFRPAKSLRPRIASTERSSARGRLLQGDVNDENAEAMGGVAGHAGMFSNAPDLAIFCQMLLNGGIYAHERILRRKTVAEFTSANALAANTRTLGWNMPSGPSPSGRYYSSGRHLSKQSFGHTGYTGTSIWIDPVKELFVVLLTNAARVHENPEDDLIRRVQPAVHDAVIECLDLVPSECKA